MSDRTLIAETVYRLLGVVPADHVYISTTENFRTTMQELIPEIPVANFIIEPFSRGTPAAFALFAQHLYRIDPDAVIFTLASDHAIAEVDRFHETMQTSYSFIEANNDWLSIVGVAPSRPDTGLGYIRALEIVQDFPRVLRVEKYAEKPTQEVAQSYIESGSYFWNAAYYCFRADTLLDAYQLSDPRLVDATSDYLDSEDPRDYERAPVAVHEVDIIDTTKTPLALVPAEFTWSDIGTWASLHRTLSELIGKDVIARNHRRHTDVGSSNALVLNTDQRIVVTAGLEHIGVIATEDALLVVDMRRVEEMPSIMQELLEKLQKEGKERYL